MIISIIISVYNLERYIGPCLESLEKQDFQDFEIIVVNDGSTDKSKQICLEFAKQSAVVKYFEKENGGASSARNFGLLQSQGEYVIFVDGDDYFDDKNALQKIANKLVKKPDLVLYGCKDLDEKNNRLVVSRNNYDIDAIEKASKTELLRYLVENNLFPGAAWLVCVNRLFLIQNNIAFKEGIKAEDLDWLVNVFVKLENITALNEPFYIYRKNRIGSATHSFSVESVAGVLYLIDTWYKKINENDELHPLFKILNKHYLLLILLTVDMDCNLKEHLYKYNALLFHPSNIRTTIISYFARVVGIDLTNKMGRQFLNRV